MKGRSAPALYLAFGVLVLTSTAIETRNDAGGHDEDQLRIKREILETDYNLDNSQTLTGQRNALESSLLDKGKNVINPGEPKLNYDSSFSQSQEGEGFDKTGLGNRYRNKRSTDDNYVVESVRKIHGDPVHHNVERKEIPGDLYSETVIHNLEQTSDKVESDMMERKSKIPERNSRDTYANKVVYNIGEELSVEVPLTTKVQEKGVHSARIMKRDIVGGRKDIVDLEGQRGVKKYLLSEDKVTKPSGSSGWNKLNTRKSNSTTRRDEVPLSSAKFFNDDLDDGGLDEAFQVRDKSADLEIHADSTGVKVKAKPASLQVVSNPRGEMKTLPGETHVDGVTAERRTFTPLLPEEEGKRRKHRRRHHRRFFHGLDPSPFLDYPSLDRRYFHRHRHHHHHRLPWLRHRQHINYPDIFERMRDQNPLPDSASAFSPPPSFGSAFSFNPQMSSPMMNYPSIMPEGGPGMPQMMGGANMNGPMMPQLLQRSPPVETNPANRFGVPESPMGEMPRMPSMGQMGEVGFMGQMGPMGTMGQMMNPMPGISPMSLQDQMSHKSNALEFWGTPNQDQLKALARGESVQKVLGTNTYGENLGGIVGNMMGDMNGGGKQNMMPSGPGFGMHGDDMGMNMPGEMNPSMSGSGVNFMGNNGMGNGGMMGQFGTSGTTGAMFNGMSQRQSGIMSNPVRGNALFKKDDINKTADYKKAVKSKDAKSRDDGVNSGKKMTHESEKFEKGLLDKAKSLVAGDKHIAKDEHTPLLREHRIRKSSKLPHDDEKRSLPQDNNSEKSFIKSTKQRAKNVKGSKKDVAVQRPPIIYHPAPEVYHRPDIVVHRAPVLFQRPPIVYHQPPVVIHRPAVVYRQPPIIFHQPYPVVNQPYYRAMDNFLTHPVMSHVGSNVLQSYNYLGVPPEVTGYRKGVVPKKPENTAKISNKNKGEIKKTKREFVAGKTNNEGSRNKNTKVPQKKKKDVVVNRPPIIYHPPPEVYHRPEIVVHRAPLLIRRPPIVYHQPAVIVHRPPVVYHQPPIIFHQPVPTVNQPVLYSHDNFVVHPSFFATHRGSVVSDAGQLLGIPNTVSVPDTAGFPFEPAGVNAGGFIPGGLGPGPMGPIAPMRRKKRSLKGKKKIKRRRHENARRKNAIMVKRPSIVYHPPPEVYHRPDIVVHRAPIVVHRGPIVYHQPPVVVHRPSVVYHQPAVLFHQPPPLVHQPVVQAHDVYTPHSTLKFVSSSATYVPSYAGFSTDATSRNAFGKSVVPKSGSAKKSESNVFNKESVMDIVNEEISESDAKILARFFSLSALDHVSVRQLVSIIEDRKNDKNSLKPIVRDSRLKQLKIDQLALVEDFLDQKKVSPDKLLAFLSKRSVLKLSIKKVGTALKKFAENLKKSRTEESTGSKKADISKSNDDKKAHKKNAVLVKRPPIVYHPPPEVYHRPDIILHRAPLVIHRAPVVYHQPPVVVHRPAVVYHQPPVLFHQPPPMVRQPVFKADDVYHETAALTHQGSTVLPHGTYIGAPSELFSPNVAYGKSQVPAAKQKHQFKMDRRSVPKEDKTEKPSKKNAVLVKRPPIIYHPPPEVYHRPDIIVHRAPIVIHRAPLVYHQPPVIVHRPAVVYHQPAVVFHQPPPVVHQPLFSSHDTFTSHDTLTLGGSSTTKIGDYLGPPQDTLATRKENVPRHKDVSGAQRSTIERTHKEVKHQSKKDNKANPSRRSRLRKLILSLQKDHDERKDSGLRTLMVPSSPLVLPRPPLVLQRPPLVMNQPMVAPIVQRVLTPIPIVQQVVRPVAVPVVYHHHHWPVQIHHHHLQPVIVAPRPVPVPVPHVHYTNYYHYPYPYQHYNLQYNPSLFGKAFVPKNAKFTKNSKKQKIDIYDYGVPAHGHVGHVHGHSHVVNSHGYVVQHADCPKHCSSCYPNCPSDCNPHCVTIVHHQHHRPQHIFVDHQHHHHLAQTHFHQHQWPVHHFDVHHGYPHFSHRRPGHPFHSYRRRDVNEDPNERTTVPHYVVYQQVKHWHPPCLHHDVVCHHHHHPSTVYHEHHHPVHAYHHHHYHPYPVYHHHEHIKPIIYHHVKPYPVHHHHDHYIHETWHHDHHHDHFHPPVPYPVPVEVPSPLVPYPVPVVHPHPVCAGHAPAPIICRSHVPGAGKPDKKSKISEKPLEEKGKNKKKGKKDVVVNRPPIIYHPPPEVYHRPEIVVHRAPVLIHRPPIVYHQSAVVVHRPPVVYHQPPIVFHQPTPTVNQPILYSHDNFVVHPTMFATHAGTMVESAGHFLGLPTGPTSNFPEYSPYPPMGDFGSGFPGMAPYATPVGRRRRSTNTSAKKPDRKNSIVVHRPPIVYHPPPEIYHRPSVIVHRPDVLIHRPPVVYHQPPVVLHRPSVVYHQTPIVFHQPPPMVNQPLFHSHDSYVPHPIFTHYNSDVHHVGSFYGIPHYGEDYHGFHGGFGGFHGFDGGFHGYGVGFHGYGGGFPGFGGGFGSGFVRSKVEKSKDWKTEERKKEKKHRVRREEKSKKGKHFGKSPAEQKKVNSERAHRKHSVVVNRPPVVFHPAPEVFHRPPYVVHQPDIVIHRPPVVYHQPPVIVHHPPVAYHQPPIMFSQHHPVIVAPSLHHHELFGGYGCMFGGAGCFGSGFHGYPFLYGKSHVSKPKRPKHSHMKSAKGSKKHDIVIHRPPLVYHPPPEIYHRPDIVVHRPDVLVHRPSIVYDQPSLVLHRPAVVYHEPPVVFHQPPPMAHLPVYHADDIYAPHPVFTQAGSHLEFDHNVVGTPESFGPEDCHDYFGCPGGYGAAHPYGKSKIEKHARKHSRGDKRTLVNHKKENGETRSAHKKYHLMVHRPPIVYHPAPTFYHRPDVVVHQPDIVIHRPSVVFHPPPVVVHKPAVVYREPPVVFHQPPPAVHQPLYHSHDAYMSHPVFTHVGSEIEHEGNYIGHPDYHNDYHHDLGFGFGHHGYPYNGAAFPGFGKSKIQKSEKEKTTAAKKHTKDEIHDNRAKDDEESSKVDKRDTTATKIKRVQFPHAQEEKTETGTKKNAIVVRRPPIIYHPPPEVYHRPDIVVHRAPIVIQRAPLVYHQAPVIVHRPAVVYHQPAVVFHQPPPAVHQPVFHSVDNFNVHPHLQFSQAASSVQQVGNYIGIPDQVMHRSNIARHNRKSATQKHRRALLEKDITPITPLNFFHRSQTNFEQPRSTIPYPSLHALHPYSLSYASFPWGIPSRRKRYIDPPGENLLQNLPYMPTEPPSLPRYGSLYTHPLSPPVDPRPHVNVNIETVKSKVPSKEPRSRRQLPKNIDSVRQTEFPESVPMASSAQQYMRPAMQYEQASPYPGLPRPHVNVNVETVKSIVPSSQARSRRQILAGLPLEESQPSLTVPSVYPRSYAFVPNISPGTTGGNSEDPLSVSKDLISALYGTPRGTRSRRPKVSIMVQTSKSEIPTPGKNVKRKSVVPKANPLLKKMNVDAFNTMPEVTTIEPPLLRDGVRVNMVDLGNPSLEKSIHLADVTPRLPIPDDGSMRRFGNMMGPGAQGDFGIDRWKKSGVERDHKVASQRKSSISEPNLVWQDENAEKKSDVPAGKQLFHGKKRYMVTRYQSPEQFPDYQDVSETQQAITAGGQPESAGYGYGTPVNTASQPNRDHISVNVETVKNVLPKTPKRRAIDMIFSRKRQLIGTVPLVSLVQPNPNNFARPSLKSKVPTGNTMVKNNARHLSKRQEVMGTLPMMQVIPQLRHAVSPGRGPRAKPATGYPAFPVNDVQPALPTQVPSVLSLQGDQSTQSFQSHYAQPVTNPQIKSYTQIPVSEEPPQHVIATPVPYQNAPGFLYPWGGRPRPNVDVNVETIKSKIPLKSSSKNIVTPRFKRDYPVLYNIIKAKAKNTKERRETFKRRSKRQTPFFTNENFLQDLIPDANELAKRAFYDSVPRYPVYPAELFPRAFRPSRPATSPQKVSLGNLGAIEVGSAGSSSTNAASLLKNEFSQNFDDIAKIQRQEVNAIKGMNSMTSQPNPPLVSVPEEQASTPFTSASLSGPAAAENPVVSPLQQQQPQSIVTPVATEQVPRSFSPTSQITRTFGQPDPMLFSVQPTATAPAILRAKPTDQQAPEPVTQVADTTAPSKPGITDAIPLPRQLPDFPSEFSFPGVQFQPAEFPLLQYPPSPFMGSMPHQPDPSGEEEDRPSVKIQVQTSKSNIPKFIKKKLEKKKHSQKHSK